MMLVMLGVMFLGSMQPVMMVVSLVLITLLYSVYMYVMMMSFWYSYGLIMVMLSGVFVVLTYMASLSPNEEFEIYGMIIFVLVLFICFSQLETFMGEVYSECVCLNLWVSYLSFFMLFLVILLLSVMMMVIWLSCSSKGALRVV